jgi:predicted TIM-barrel fold metal-dependent hydrolase
MDAAGVAAAVLVPPMWEGDRNDLVTAAARLHPRRFCAMGRFDPAAPDARARIASWKEQPGMLGMRFTFHRPTQRPLLADDLLAWLWPLAEDAQIPVTMLVRHADMPLVDRLAERHPTLRISLDHLGLTSGKDEEAFAGLPHVLALARRPNVAVKLSALPRYTTSAYPHAPLHTYLQRVYDAFGPKRMFWGTDLTHLHCSYRQAVTMFTEEIPWLTTDDKMWIMGGALCEWLNWAERNVGSGTA